MTGKVYAGSGTRDIVTNPAAMEWVLKYLVTMIRRCTDNGIEPTTISGMAEGFDELVARASIICGVPFWAYIPHPEYGDWYWRKRSKTGRNRLTEFNELLAQAEKQVMVAKGWKVQGEYSMLVRNRFMVNAAEKLWVYNRFSAGTSQCYNYAVSIKRPIFLLPLYEAV